MKRLSKLSNKWERDLFKEVSGNEPPKNVSPMIKVALRGIRDIRSGKKESDNLEDYLKIIRRY
ncbi:MAG: hypothetical protein M1122_00915 [Candidatus Marsarchaeota archaeon]|jgi:hypothetical protein|nr:hypothetical protein [Candidatus Marsarchaeota archaeon]